MLATLLTLAAVSLPAPVSAELGKFRVAEPADYIETVRVYARQHPREDLLRGVVELDLNGDGRPDYGILAVEPASRDFRFVLALSTPDGGYAFPEKRRYRGAFPQRGGIVYVAMERKQANELKWADQLYSKLKPGTGEREAYKAASALGVWRSVGLDPYSRPDDYEVSSLAYCTDVFYAPGGKLRSFLVCD